jgi:hypothetical protein
LRIRLVSGQPSVNLLALTFRERLLLGLGSNAVPDLLNQSNAFTQTQSVDTE